MRKDIRQKLGNKTFFIYKPYTAAVFSSFLILNPPIIKKHHKHEKHCIPQAQVLDKNPHVLPLSHRKNGILRLEMKPECKVNVFWSRMDTAVQGSSRKTGGQDAVTTSSSS